MKADLVHILCCPARDCQGADLILEVGRTTALTYRAGQVEEVEEGSLRCSCCGRVYPIQEYVPSFDQLFPECLREEAEYWGRLYGLMLDRGYKGFFDMREPLAPLLTEGVEVADPGTTSGKDLECISAMLAGHPLVRDAEWVLDIGSGTGWTSLYLARCRHKVISFDPNVYNMRLAKRYAIEQGEYIEYMGAALGYLAFKPETFDAIFALHSLHHVPHLRDEMRILREWLRKGGAIAVDEHIQNNPTMVCLAASLRDWARTEILPRYITLDLEQRRAQLSHASHSTMEDAGSREVIASLMDNFVFESMSSRYISLDMFSFLFYLHNDLNEQAYHWTAAVIDRIYRLFLDAFPEGVEHVTVVARRDDSDDGKIPELNALELQARKLIQGAERHASDLEKLRVEIERINSDMQAMRDYIFHVERTVATKNAHIEQLEDHIKSLENQIARQQKALSLLPVRIAARVARTMRRWS